VLAPVHDPQLRDRLDEILDVLLDAGTFAWHLAGDGNWSEGPGTVDAQARLEQIALDRARRITALS
jgi:polyphosphate kinase